MCIAIDYRQIQILCGSIFDIALDFMMFFFSMDGIPSPSPLPSAYIIVD